MNLILSFNRSWFSITTFIQRENFLAVNENFVKKHGEEQTSCFDVETSRAVRFCN